MRYNVSVDTNPIEDRYFLEQKGKITVFYYIGLSLRIGPPIRSQLTIKSGELYGYNDTTYIALFSKVRWPLRVRG